jgi:uncharacterized protein (DUF433 family)
MKMTRVKSNNSKSKTRLVRETRGDESYQYYSLGKYVVSAPDVCGGRPTFKHTRLEVSVILSLIAQGETVQQVVEEYSASQLTPAAVIEAIRLADRALVQSARVLQPAA